MAERPTAYLKDAWARELVLVAFFTTGAGGAAYYNSALLCLPHGTKYAMMINQVTAYNQPVPPQDDGNMPHMPSHPQDLQGPRLEWLKKL
ncbi:NADH dehydrogenase [ubiquinone] 1 alpha subcomplex subunit 3-like [Lontra canadensis]|uniref:NADH dehydrogenase [ubiquinone] 1 alpha subcomplex subunit 3-like n=1 Tax=Lontra canadensis TaxID=76717 RepID=UPI0013F30F2F|nr:NADH dehydrogenase [ubiquinone] 1 alpha subcomplex subunit 3-like [Lontra canadensis]